MSQLASSPPPLFRLGPQAEAALVRKVQGGDLDAFERLLLECGHARRLRAWLAVREPSSSVVEDVIQESFVVAYRRIADFRAETDFGAWLRAIAFQCQRQERKRFAVRQRQLEAYATQLLTEAASSAPAPVDDALTEHLERCLDRLDPTARTLIGQRYRAGDSVAAIADSAGQSVGWVRITLYRIRQQLRQCIEKRRATAAPSTPA